MTVWIVNPFDNLPTEGTRPQRYWLMAEAFVRTGCEVVYWTSDFSHANKRRRIETDERCSRAEKGITAIQIPTRPYRANICLARILSHRQLAKDFERRAQEVLVTSHAPSLIIASMPPLGLCAAACRVARTCDAAFIADIQDAWPETFERLVPRSLLTLVGLSRAARKIYCGADGVSAVAQRYLDLARAYGAEAPMHLAGHAIKTEMTAADGGTSVRPRAQGEGRISLVYIGNMSLSYDLETLIRAVLSCEGVTLDLAGEGPDRVRLEEMASRGPTAGRIRFHGYLNERKLAEFLRNGDVGLVPMFPESCVGVPGKLADYASAGLRVIESLGGETGEIVRKYGAGTHYEAGNVESLAAAIAEEKSFSGSAAEQPFDRKGFAKAFDARTIMDAYVEWACSVKNTISAFA